MRTMVVMALLISIVGAPLDARAQTADAEEQFTRGAALYYEGEYVEVIVAFKRAHALDANPLYLINIALAHWRLDNLDAAIRHAEQAASSERLDAPTAAQNRARLQAWYLTSRARASEPPPDPVAVEEEPGVAAAIEAPQAEPQRRGSTFLWAGVGLGAVGAGALVGASVLELRLGQLAATTDAAIEANDRETYEDAVSEFEVKQPVARVLFVAGSAFAALAVTSLVVHVARGRRDPEVSVALHGTGLKLGVSF